MCFPNLEISRDTKILHQKKLTHQNMFALSVACVTFCLILSVSCAPQSATGELENIVKQIEKIKSVQDRQESSHYQILGIFEPSEAYFTQQQGTKEKRSWGRRHMRCIRFDHALRRCSRFAMVGIWK